METGTEFLNSLDTVSTMSVLQIDAMIKNLMENDNNDTGDEVNLDEYEEG